MCAFVFCSEHTTTPTSTTTISTTATTTGKGPDLPEQILDFRAASGLKQLASRPSKIFSIVNHTSDD